MQRSLRFMNLLGYLLMIAIHILANYLPLGGKTTREILQSQHSLFTPANYTFMIWGLIYLLLLGFIVYQLLPSQKYNTYMNKLGIYFILTCIINVLWLFAWHYGKMWLSLVLVVILLIFLIEIYKRLEIGNCRLNLQDRLWVNVPFSMYLAWVSVATIANTAITLKYYGWKGFGLSDTIWTVIVILLALLLTLMTAGKTNDLVFILTIMWAFVGILVRHWGSNTAISITLIAALVILVFQVFGKYKKYLCIK